LAEATGDESLKSPNIYSKNKVNNAQNKMLYAQKSDERLSNSNTSLKRMTNEKSGKPPKGKKMKDRDYSPYR